MAATTDTGEVGLLQRSDATGKRQGRYVLGELLGRGGMAEVFAGQSMGSHGFQKPVAIKRLLPELANDTVFVERLIGEAKLLVGMQHGNIVSVLDLARDGDDVFLVMEFMDGPSVRQLLKARGTKGLPIGVATYIVQNAAAGLEFAHNRRDGAVIHADISPSNILLTTSGEVRVADFGIARREGNGGGVVEGKWAYMAPEQARGEALTPRSDVFALGVVLYELICGQHPLGRQVTADERESAPLHVVPPRQVKASIPVGIDKICMKALSHDPRDRYARMQQFIDALVEERFANGWREGANDLANVIRDVTPGSGGTHAGPKTMHTDRPLTIVTRSLISQPQSRPPSVPPVHVDPQPPLSGVLDSGAQTRMMPLEAPPPTPMPPQQVPVAGPGSPTQMLRADGTPPQQQVPTPVVPAPAMIAAFAASMLPTPELASVHGGNTFTGSSSAVVAVERNNRWAFGVLGVAALVGAIGAVVLGAKHTGGDDDVAATEPITQPQAITATPITPPPAPPVAVVVAPPVVPDKTPDKVPDKTPDKVATAAETQKPAGAQETAKPVASNEKATTSLEARIAAKRQTATKTAPPVAAQTSQTSKKAGETFLLVDEWNGEYANIKINGQSKDTPSAKFYVAPGKYQLFVSNDSEHFTCRVTLDPGKSLHVHVSLENRTCND